MDNIQLILYIVFLVGYFIFKVLTGKKKSATSEDTRKFDQPQNPHRETREYTEEYEQYDPEADRPKTFEEILEELAGGGRKKEAPKAAPNVPEKVVEKRRETPKPAEVYRDGQDFEAEAKQNEVYQKSIQQASKYSTLDERIDMDNLEINRKEVVDIEEIGAEKKSNPYLDLFSNLEDAKKAVILSEILNRKY